MADSDQWAQVEALQEASDTTGPGPTEDNEEELLREKFGDPDEDGIYGRCCCGDDVCEECGLHGDA